MSAVAERAGVSTATVSRVLNGDPRVGRGYRERVAQAVAEVGYRPNRLARGLRTQRSATIGVIVSDIENPHFGAALRAIEEIAHRRGHPVLVCNTDETASKQRTYLQTMLDERVRGVILAPSDPRDETIGALLDGGVPVVAFDREVADERADAVLAENVRGARMATGHLLAAGRRDVVFVGGRADVETGAERLDGYEIAMREAGLAPRRVAGDFRERVAYEAVRELLRTAPPDALLVANNLMTLGALAALREAGARVPDDVALVAMDDPPWAPFVDPPLTTAAQPVRRMAADAMELLLERVRGERTSARRVVHPFALHVRASCGSDRG